MSLSDIMSAAGLSTWTEVALILCFVTFAAIVFWVFVVRSKLSWEHQGSLPLDATDDRNDAPTTPKGGELR